MIHVFFVPGMFGSTIEHVLRNYTKEYSATDGEILADGSMHSFRKEFHPVCSNDLTNINAVNLLPDSITTPIYPLNHTHLTDILKIYPLNSAHCILVYAETLRDAELNCLFQYHKIAFGTNVKHGLSIFCGDNSKNIKNWNSRYNSWREMQPWELREWFSIFYPNWVSEWIDSPLCVNNDWLKISNKEILDRPCESFKKIIEFSHLTLRDNLNTFIDKWISLQQYILNEFYLLDKIIDAVIHGRKFTWGKINIIAESIIQQRLRKLGYEILCDGLNDFPTDSENLYKLLVKS